MRPEHISAYHLIYEEDTPLWNLKEAHQVEETDEDLSVSLFKELIHTLKSNGYEHYEISISADRDFIHATTPVTGQAKNTWVAVLLPIPTTEFPDNGT